MSLPRPSRPVQTDEAATSPGKLDKRKFRPSDVFRFDPKPDITAYELACLVAAFWTLDVHFERFFQFPEPLQRHFRHHKI